MLNIQYVCVVGSMGKKDKKKVLVALSLSLLIIVVTALGTLLIIDRINKPKEFDVRLDKDVGERLAEKGNEPFSADKYTDYNEIDELKALESRLAAADTEVTDREFYNGNRVNIMIIGVDSRLGNNFKHADANHIVSINFATRKIDIISIPRDTPTDKYHVDTVHATLSGKRIKRLRKGSADSAVRKYGITQVPMPNDTTGRKIFDSMYAEAPLPDKLIRIDTLAYKIAEYRACYGMKEFLKKSAEIAGVEKIHYYVEFGFSQAQGLLEFMGHDNPKASLQVLRSRKVMRLGDYQRCYNQGQFIRQMMIRYFDNLSGVTGSIILRGALALVDTDMSYREARSLYDRINESHFDMSPSSIDVTVKPAPMKKFRYLNFADKATLDSIQGLISEYAESTEKENMSNSSDAVEQRVVEKLQRALDKAVKDSSRSYRYVINDLKVYFSQHAWLQISDIKTREYFRDNIANMLILSYEKVGQPRKAEEIKYIIEAEKALLEKKELLNNSAAKE